MKFTKSILASAVLLTTSSIAFAAVDSTDITINVTKDAYVNLIGSLNSSLTVPLTEAAVNGGSTTLGTLGFESNTTGTCNVTFASLNNYKLVHDTNTALDLGDYTLTYVGLSGNVSNSAASNGNDYAAASCNESAANLNIANPVLPAVVTAGTYSDTITVTVTTQ